MQILARAALRADVIAAPVSLGRSVQGLVDVADPMAKESCSIALTAHSSASGHSSPREAGRVAREIDEVLGCALPRPIGPIA
jgi:hypothetical protein